MLNIKIKTSVEDVMVQNIKDFSKNAKSYILTNSKVKSDTTFNENTSDEEYFNNELIKDKANQLLIEAKENLKAIKKAKETLEYMELFDDSLSVFLVSKIFSEE